MTPSAPYQLGLWASYGDPIALGVSFGDPGRVLPWRPEEWDFEYVVSDGKAALLHLREGDGIAKDRRTGDLDIRGGVLAIGTYEHVLLGRHSSSGTERCIFRGPVVVAVEGSA